MLPLSFQNFLLKCFQIFHEKKYFPPKITFDFVGKGYRCTLRSDDAVKGAKERLPREEEEIEGRRRKEGIQLKIFTDGK